MIRARGAALWSVVVKFDLDGSGVARAARVTEFSPAPTLNEYVLAAIQHSTFKAGAVANDCVYVYYQEFTPVKR
jgi:outer membrane biosynthesis protein TonB